MTLLHLHVSGILVLFSLFICSYFRLCVYISFVRTPEKLLNHLFCRHVGALSSHNMLMF